MHWAECLKTTWGSNLMLPWSIPHVQGVRSLCRFFLLFFLPVFFGPYWSWVHVQTNFAFAFFFSILVGALGWKGLGWRVVAALAVLLAA